MEWCGVNAFLSIPCLVCADAPARPQPNKQANRATECVVECNSIFLTVTIIVVLIIARARLKCGQAVGMRLCGVFLHSFFCLHSFVRTSFVKNFFSAAAARYLFALSPKLNSLSPECVCINSPQNFTSL